MTKTLSHRSSASKSSQYYPFLTRYIIPLRMLKSQYLSPLHHAVHPGRNRIFLSINRTRTVREALLFQITYTTTITTKMIEMIVTAIIGLLSITTSYRTASATKRTTSTTTISSFNRNLPIMTTYPVLSSN